MGLRDNQGKTLLTLGEVYAGTLFDASEADDDPTHPEMKAAERFFSKGVAEHDGGSVLVHRPRHLISGRHLASARLRPVSYRAATTSAKIPVMPITVAITASASRTSRTIPPAYLKHHAR